MSKVIRILSALVAMIIVGTSLSIVVSADYSETQSNFAENMRAVEEFFDGNMILMEFGETKETIIYSSTGDILHIVTKLMPTDEEVVLPRNIISDNFIVSVGSWTFTHSISNIGLGGHGRIIHRANINVTSINASGLVNFRSAGTSVDASPPQFYSLGNREAFIVRDTNGWVNAHAFVTFTFGPFNANHYSTIDMLGLGNRTISVVFMHSN